MIFKCGFSVKWLEGYGSTDNDGKYLILIFFNIKKHGGTFEIMYSVPLHGQP